MNLFSLFLIFYYMNNTFNLDGINIYAYTQQGMFSETAKSALYRVYVPNSLSGTVSIIDPSTYQVIQTISTGKIPQHVVPSYDMKTLWVLNNKSNELTPINPLSSQAGTNIAVTDPYNLYFTMDGKYAIVVCESRKQFELRDPRTMALIDRIPFNCRGANHMEFSPDGSYAIVTCEFSGQLMKVDFNNKRILSYLSLVPSVTTSLALAQEAAITRKQQARFDRMNAHTKFSMPQDIRSTQDGQIFIVADMLQDGLVLIDPEKFIKIGFVPTGIGTHGIYPNRNGTLFYVSNRGCHHVNCSAHGPGSVSVVDAKQLKVVANWPIPSGGSPDMGNISPDGSELWLSGRYDSEVYVFDTTTGLLTHRIPVGNGPHGLAIWPQPGRFSLGHTGNMR